VHISVSSAGYNTFRGSVKSTGYPLHSPVFPSLPISCVTVCCQVSNALLGIIIIIIISNNNNYYKIIIIIIIIINSNNNYYYKIIIIIIIKCLLQ